MISATWAAVRPGASRLSFTARSSTAAGVVGSAARLAGTRASKPPARQARIQRSMVLRATRTRSPLGPVWSRAGQGADQLAPLGLGQRRVGRLPDERVAEQRHVTVAVIHEASWHSRASTRRGWPLRPAAA